MMTNTQRNNHRNRFSTTFGLIVLAASLGLPGCMMEDFASELPDSELPDSELPDSELPDSELPDSELPDSELPDGDVTKSFWTHEYRTDISGVDQWDTATLHVIGPGQSLTAASIGTSYSNSETVLGRCLVNRVYDNGWKWPYEVPGFSEFEVKLSTVSTWIMFTAFQHDLICENDSGYQVEVRLRAVSVRR